VVLPWPDYAPSMSPPTRRSLESKSLCMIPLFTPCKIVISSKNSISTLVYFDVFHQSPKFAWPRQKGKVKKNSLPSPPLPPDAIAVGFSTKGESPKRPRAFTLKRGPIGEARDDSELGAFLRFVNGKFRKHIVEKATEIRDKKGLELEASKSTFFQYVLYIIACGLVSYAQERLPFRRDDAHGLFKNDFLTSIFNHEELLQAKKMFLGDRDSMTEIFNELSIKSWIPGQ